MREITYRMLKNTSPELEFLEVETNIFLGTPSVILLSTLVKKKKKKSCSKVLEICIIILLYPEMRRAQMLAGKMFLLKTHMKVIFFFLI